MVAAGKPPTDSTTMKEDEASRSTIGAIVLDEAATVEDSEAKEYGDEVDDDEEERSEEEVRSAEEEKEAKLLSNYAKAHIPKLPLAEANFMMKQLSDDYQAFMRRALLIGLEWGGGSMGIGRTPNELARLSEATTRPNFL